jgi:uncharacterized protein (TIGR03437 family)
MFTAEAATTASTGIVTLTTSVGSSKITFNVTVDQIRPVLLTCAPNPLTAGALLICKVDLNAPSTLDLVLVNTSNSSAIRVPLQTIIPAGALSGRIVAYSDVNASSQTVQLSTTFDFRTVATQVSVKPVSQTTSARLKASRPQVLSDPSELSYENAGRERIARPVIASVVNAASALPGAACSPGAAAMLMGQDLVASDADDVRVEVNGDLVPLLSTSPSRVVFECPDSPTGTRLNIVLINGLQSSNDVVTEMQEVSPGMFTINGDGTGLGLVLRGDTIELASVPNSPDENVASLDGEVVSIVATGLGRTFGSGPNTLASFVIVTVDGIAAEVVSARAIGAGAYQIDARLPAVTVGSDTVEVQVQIPASNGQMMQSNTVEMSVRP